MRGSSYIERDYRSGCGRAATLSWDAKHRRLSSTESELAMTQKSSPESPGTPATDIEALAAADRRKRNIPVAVDRRRQNAAEKRRTSERRRLIDPTTCERDYDEAETAFMKAMER